MARTCTGTSGQALHRCVLHAARQRAAGFACPNILLTCCTNAFPQERAKDAQMSGPGWAWAPGMAVEAGVGALRVGALGLDAS